MLTQKDALHLVPEVGAVCEGPHVLVCAQQVTAIPKPLSYSGEKFGKPKPGATLKLSQAFGLHVFIAAKKHLDRALGRYFWFSKSEMYPQKYPSIPQQDARSRMEISDSCRGGALWSSVYFHGGVAGSRAGLRPYGAVCHERLLLINGGLSAALCRSTSPPSGGVARSLTE